MNFSLARVAVVTLVALATASGTSEAQAAAASSPASARIAPDARLLRVARTIMRDARYCALITQDASGRANARTIDPTLPDSNMVVHFATTPKSRKVAQIARDDRVSLYYFDTRALSYVTLYGRARLLTDTTEKRRRWKAEWAPFYPARERGAAMYEVIPERMEIVSPRDKVVGDSVTWAPVLVPLKSPPPR